jgi:hypothetical protein
LQEPHTDLHTVMVHVSGYNLEFPHPPMHLGPLHMAPRKLLQQQETSPILPRAHRTSQRLMTAAVALTQGNGRGPIDQ